MALPTELPQPSTNFNDFTQEIARFGAENAAQTAAALSVFVSTMREEGVGLSEQQRREMLADFWQQQSEQYATRADELAANAALMGDPERGGAWERAAADMRDYAAEQSSMSVDERLELNRLNISRTMDLIGRYGGPVGDAITYTQLVDAVNSGDFDAIGEISTSSLFGLAGAVVGVSIASLLTAPGWGTALTAAFVGALFSEAGKWGWNQFSDDARGWVTDRLTPVFELFDQFMNFINPPRRDPLALDLDGDGIETLAANGYSGVLFDQNGDGIKRATGWVASDDGLLALDRNGNGIIDDGTELFGNNTTITDGVGAGAVGGGMAESGLAALADLDTNADGLMNASDAQFANLRVWRDLNSDGISQSNELFTLNDLGITSLSTGGTLDVNTDLGNGNSIVNNGSFTWADGRKGDMADLALQEQTIYREFTDDVTITAAAAALPDIVATGPVRDLREAMSLDASGSLTNLVSQISAATTRDEQKALAA